jgi:hypothetical protein
LCLISSCVILVLGFKKLITVIQSNDHLVNKAMIIWHITAYIFIVISKFCRFFLATLKKYSISTYCVLAINLACTVILAVIVNEICSKALQARISSEDVSLDFVLDDSYMQNSNTSFLNEDEIDTKPVH